MDLSPFSERAGVYNLPNPEILRSNVFRLNPPPGTAVIGPRSVDGGTGMGYQIASIYLKNGQRYDQVMAVEGRITSIKDDPNIPFTEADIERIVVTHNKWK
jgi:hypothetical protein